MVTFLKCNSFLFKESFYLCNKQNWNHRKGDIIIHDAMGNVVKLLIRHSVKLSINFSHLLLRKI
jgi:hypothetical protein